jgi:hypothetical protein
MNCLTCFRIGCYTLVSNLICLPLFSQDNTPPKIAKNAPDATAGDDSLGPHRKLAPGVLHTVPAMVAVEDMFSRHDIVELLAVDKDLALARNVPFRHDIWCLEFQFKTVRMINVDLPQANGQVQRKLIWYMVYAVTNRGKAMHPVTQPDGSYEVETKDYPVRFVPQFSLVGYESMSGEAAFESKDHVIPLAAEQIRLREDPTRKFLTSAEITGDLAVGQTRWGVATWEDVTPRMKRFSILVGGLTNAYQWTDTPGAYKDPAKDGVGTGRHIKRKTLKLNFWRPGDEFFPHEEEIRYGIPGGVDYQWVWQLEW